MPKDWKQWFSDYIEFHQHRIDMLSEHSKRLTPIEAIVLLSLLDLAECFGTHNFFISPQARIGKYRVDFLVEYHPLVNESIHKRIVIECDGHKWHERSKKQVAKDKKRDRYLTKEGYTVFRYSGSEIVNDRHQITSDIEEFLLPDQYKEGFGYKKDSQVQR